MTNIEMRAMNNIHIGSAICSNKLMRPMALMILCTSSLTLPLLATPAQAQTICQPLPQYPTSGTNIVQGSSTNSATQRGNDGEGGSGDGGNGGLPSVVPSVTILNCGTLQSGLGLNAQSTGGRGGDGTSAIVVTAGKGGNGGDGGTVIVENLSGGTISTNGFGIYGFSLGGNGGNGGGRIGPGSGADGGIGGNGGAVTVANIGSITTQGDKSHGIFGVTMGGQAGSGGYGGWFSQGGAGGAGGNSGADVTGFNAGMVVTSGNTSTGMALHSIGGTGGEGGRTSTGFFAVGGNGAPGGFGGDIDAQNLGTITTNGYNSKGISALSVGGGGGKGGDAFAFGLVAGVAIGGYGGVGGKAGAVAVENSGTITTSGYGSLGIRAQSVGGGGGDGGSGKAVAAGSNFVFTFAMGGSGGSGGNGGKVSVTSETSGSIITGSIAGLDQSVVPVGLILPGDYAAGILAQSIGGGGGNGHQAFTLTASAAPGSGNGRGSSSLSASVELGGQGGVAGQGGNVTASSAGSITTGGRFAPGMIAHSVGGGGGNGGNTFSVVTALSNTAGTLNLALAGAGGAGNSSGTVNATASGKITTIGTGSTGMIAQSIAGGGGNGGNTFDSSIAIATSGSALNMGVSLGGKSGTGANAGAVTSDLQPAGSIVTYGDMASGLLTQSIGGGGGNGGSVQTYAVSLQGGSGMASNVSVNLGGTANNAGTGGAADQTLNGTVTTIGHLSSGTVVQSIGGGGGNGGHVFGLDVAASLDSDSEETEGSARKASVNIGGSGGAGADGTGATLNYSGTIQTSGELSGGALIQSIGGGGGNGGTAHSYSIATAVPTSLAGLGNRLANNFKSLSSVNEQFKDATNIDIAVDIGGTGGGGGTGGDVSALLNGGAITTAGGVAPGLTAQSIGGGGGAGGSTIADGLIGISSVGVNVGIGGLGGTGASGGTVAIQQQAGQSGVTTISTSGDLSYGVLAQSIGGGGGIGGTTLANFTTVTGLSGTNVSVGVGGNGGTGNLGGMVSVSAVNVTTAGQHANAIVAQSIGGGGGSGNISDGSGGIQISLGGSGGSGNDGGTVGISNVQTASTGVGAMGIVAQSIGGGGGNSGLASMGKLVSKEVAAVGSDIGFNASGSGGNGGAVNIGCVSSSTSCQVKATTSGHVAIGILAQSIGGGGGIVQASSPKIGPVTFTIKGKSGREGDSGTVTVSDNQSNPFIITTSGDGATGIVAQSFDAGGAALIVDAAGAPATSMITASPVGQNGGVMLDLSGYITTSGNYASGALIQALSGAYVLHTPTGPTVYGGSAINAAKTTAIVEQSAIITTGGIAAHGIHLQTNSNASSAYVPTGWDSPVNPGQVRAQTVIVEGTITTSGTNAWGVYSTNGSAAIGTQAGNATTHVIVANGGTINVNSANSGGIYVHDYGSAVVEVLGSIGSISPLTGNPTAISLQAQNAKLLVAAQPFGGSSGVVTGNVVVKGMGAGSTASIQVDGTIKGELTALGKGGSISIVGSGNFGQSQEPGTSTFTPMPNGQRAITVDAGVTSIRTGPVYGDINGPAIGTPGMTAPIPLAINQITGSVVGNFALTYPSSSPVQFHSLGIDLAGGHIDTINVASMSQGGPSIGMNSLGISLIPTALPVGSFKPVTLISVAEGMTAGTALSMFGLKPNTAATQYDISVFAPVGGPATAVLNNVTIDYTRSTTGGNLQSVAQLANQQVAAIQSGTVTPDKAADLYKYLLLAAQATGADSVAAYLEILESSLHYGTAASAAAARTQGFQSFAPYSCGGAISSMVDPISQGECSWAVFDSHNSRRESVSQTDHAHGIAIGQQYELSDVFYLGFGANYQALEGLSETSFSAGDRAALAAVLKYTEGDRFGSVAIHGTYDWVKGSRRLAAGAIGSEPKTATMKQELATLGTQVRIGHRLVSKPFDLIARVDLDAAVVRDFGYTETGAGAFNMRANSSTNWLFDIHPVMQLGKRFHIGQVDFRLYGEIGRRWQFNDLKSHIGLANGFDSEYSVPVIHQRDDALMTYGAGLMIDLSKRLEVRLNYKVSEGNDYHGEDFIAKLAFKF
jgi:hypothetical protein